MTKILGPAYGYVDMLDKATTEALEEQAQKPSEYYPLRPSSSGKCTRELAYELQEFLSKKPYKKEVRKPASDRLLKLGHSIEWHVIRNIDERLKERGFSIRYKQQVLDFYELKVEGRPDLDRRIEGSLDLVLFTPDGKGVVDVKSKGDRFSNFFASKWDDYTDKLATMSSVERFGENAFWAGDLEAFLDELNDPFFAANFLQLNGYACNEFLVQRGVDHGAIIQYNKNDSRMREVRFAPSQKLHEQIRQKFQTVLEAIAAGGPENAPRDYAFGSIKCAFCPFQRDCWDKDALKAFTSKFEGRGVPPAILKKGSPIEKAFEEFEEALKASEKAKYIEQQLVLKLIQSNVGKVELANGNVYRVKDLKNETVLRRSKK